MPKLLYSATMSLDGFIAGTGGDMSWLSDHVGDPTPELDLDALIEDIGALLIGRTTFDGDDPNKGTDAEGPFGGRWHGPQIVLTHEQPADRTDPAVSYVTDLEAAVAAAKEGAGAKKYVNVLGADVARQCLEIGALDEVLVLIAPVLLGDGTRLFSHPGGTKVRLEPLDPESSLFWFRVA